MGRKKSADLIIIIPKYLVIFNAFPSMRLGKLEFFEVLYIAVIWAKSLIKTYLQGKLTIK
jgi:hypothetical protein